MQPLSVLSSPSVSTSSVIAEEAVAPQHGGHVSTVCLEAVYEYAAGRFPTKGESREQRVSNLEVLQ